VTLGDLPTPQVLIDHQRARRNIDRVQSLANAARQSLRPHSKTHKSPVIAKWQLDRGAVGICCAKVGEAEVMAAAGITNIRLPYPVNPSNAARVLALMDHATISIVVDHLEVAKGWSEAMVRAGRRLDVLIKVDVGFHRCGIDPTSSQANSMIRAVSDLIGVSFRGLLSHAGQAYHATSLQELGEIAEKEIATLRSLASDAKKSGVEIQEISVGSTPTARFSLEQRGLTELRPGNYAYFDRTQVALGAAEAVGGV